MLSGADFSIWTHLKSGRHGEDKIIVGNRFDADSIFLNHHLSSFDHGSDGVTLLELEFIGTSPCDGTLDEVLTDAHDYVSHDIAQVNFFDLPA